MPVCDQEWKSWHRLTESRDLERRLHSVMTFEVVDILDFYCWMLGRGEMIEVLGLPEIREAVMDTAEAVKEVYMKKRRNNQVF